LALVRIGQDPQTDKTRTARHYLERRRIAPVEGCGMTRQSHRRPSRAEIARSLRGLELLFSRPPDKNETATSGQAGSGGDFQEYCDKNIIAAVHRRRKAAK
jgi:hypothetical protein